MTNPNALPEFPPGFDDRTTMFLALINKIVIKHPEYWPHYLDEALKQWVEIPLIYEEGDKP